MNEKIASAFMDELQKVGIFGDIANISMMGMPGAVGEALTRSEKIQTLEEALRRVKGRGGIGGHLKYLFTPGYRQYRRGEREKGKEYIRMRTRESSAATGGAKAKERKK